MKIYFIFSVLVSLVCSQSIHINSEIRFNSLKIVLDSYLDSNFIVVIKKSPFQKDTTIQFINDTAIYKFNSKRTELIKCIPNQNDRKFKSKIGLLNAEKTSKVKTYSSYKSNKLNLENHDKSITGSLYYTKLETINSEILKKFLNEFQKLVELDFDLTGLFPMKLSLNGKIESVKIALKYKVEDLDENYQIPRFIHEMLSMTKK